MNIKSMDYYRFNSVATRIWELIADGPASEEALCGTLLEEYEVTEDECRAAVVEFLDDAIGRGFLRSV